MNPRARSFLNLIRFPNVMTAAADPLAGFLLVNGDVNDWRRYAPVLLGSMCLYAGGVTLNDVFDIEQDRRERPNRPIPAGEFSRAGAAKLAATHLLVGLALLAVFAPGSLWAAVPLVALIFAYDAGGKRTIAGPLLMGGCRALNLALGALAAGGTMSGSPLLAAVLLGVYVASVTLFAQTETITSSSFRLSLADLGVFVPFIALAVSDERHGMQDVPKLMVPVLVAALVRSMGGRAIESGRPEDVQAAVKAFVLGIVAFDACCVLREGNLIGAALVASLLIPCWITARSLRVT